MFTDESAELECQHPCLFLKLFTL